MEKEKARNFFALVGLAVLAIAAAAVAPSLWDGYLAPAIKAVTGISVQ